jgi:hypothetical protein
MIILNAISKQPKGCTTSEIKVPRLLYENGIILHNITSYYPENICLLVEIL